MVRYSQQKPPFSVRNFRTSPSPIKKVKVRGTTPKNTTWENIVLYYLSKLKGFLQPACANNCNNNHPVPGPNKTSAELFRQSQINPVRKNLKRSVKLMEPDANRYSSQCREILRRRRSVTTISSVSRAGTSTTSIREARKTKAEKIVSAAIDYGCAAGIIRNHGKYFWFKHPKTRPSRTPSVNSRSTSIRPNIVPSKLCSKTNSLAYKRKRIPTVSKNSLVSVDSGASIAQNKRRKRNYEQITRSSKGPSKCKKHYLRSLVTKTNKQAMKNSVRQRKRK